MSKRSRSCSFNSKVRDRIIARDGDACIFCASGKWPLPENDFGIRMRDIAHIVNRSQGGLGTEENGVTACRSHHQLLDNGNKGLREELLGYAQTYLSRIYPGWSKDKLIYRKGE